MEALANPALLGLDPTGLIPGKTRRPADSGPVPTSGGGRRDWLQTYSGIAVWPLEGRPEDIQIEDMAHQLAMICRFYGAVVSFYSVAEHLWTMSYLVDESEAYAALMHDAPEYLLSDVAKPLKQFAAFRVPGWRRTIIGLCAVLATGVSAQIMAVLCSRHAVEMTGLAALIAGLAGLGLGSRRYISYEQAEAALMRVISAKFSFPPVMSDSLKTADARMAVTERLQLLRPSRRPWARRAEPFPGVELHCWDPATAKRKFLERYHELRPASAPVA